jgi:hypothetical protein
MSTATIKKEWREYSAVATYREIGKVHITKMLQTFIERLDKQTI